MPKEYPIIFVLACFLACSSCAQRDDPVLKIGRIEVSSAEFEEGYKSSRYTNQPGGRQEYLKNLLRKKLILQEADRLGVDRDPEFLRDIQAYWEQGLLKLMLARKSKEMSGRLTVSDEEIERYYGRNQQQLDGRPLSEVYSQIKWIIFQEKQGQALSQWVEDLQNDNLVSIDYQRLGIK